MARKTASKRQGQAAALGLQTDCTGLYIRVSTEKQADEGFSLDAQQAKLTAYCAAMGWNICGSHVYVDAGESGKTTARPELQRMLSAARSGEIRRIVAVKLDRIARNVRAFLELVDELQAIGVDLVLLAESFDTGTPTGKFALTMFAAMAELERTQITERVMSGKLQKAQTGGFNGSPTPYGYIYSDGQFRIDDAQAAIVRRIFTEFLTGSTMADIARGLNAQAIPTKRGGKWATETVRYILRNGGYSGLTQWNGQEATGETYPAIVTVETYEAAHRRLAALKPGKPAAHRA